MPFLRIALILGVFCGWTFSCYEYGKAHQSTLDNVKQLKQANTAHQIMLSNQNQIIVGMRKIATIQDDKINRYESQVTTLTRAYIKSQKDTQDAKIQLNNANRINGQLLRLVSEAYPPVSRVPGSTARTNKDTTYYSGTDVAGIWELELNNCGLNTIQLQNLIENDRETIQTFNQTVRNINGNK